MLRFVFLLTFSFSIALPFTAFGDDAPRQKSLVGRKIENFTLKDYRGKQHALADYKEARLIVLAFLGTECPLVKLYAPRLAKLDERFADDEVVFLGINSNRQDAITEIAAYARNYSLKFPLLKDLGNRVADRLEAVRTPTVYVLDEDRVVRYQGRIDDQYGIGYIRNEPRRNDLEVALNALLKGEPVETPLTEAVGCFIGRIREPEPDAKVTYSDQIARILQSRCVECHRTGEIAPFSLTSYNEVAGWAETIEEVIEDQRMPPWHADHAHGEFANDRTMTAREKKLISRWVAAGAPQGDPADLPEPEKFVTGWQLPRQPDRLIAMRDEPFTVPAEGVVRYQYFITDPGFKEDKWVKMAEVVPGNRAVVHHILVFVLRPGEKRLSDGVGRFLAAYVPGMRARGFPEGMAKFVPAGSKLVFQLHYTPIGTVQSDQSRLGLIFADPETITHEVVTEYAIKRRLSIPPRADDYEVAARPRKIPAGAKLLAFMPHMHLRGKSFRYELRYPDGRREIALNVPRYDFNWQTNYVLAEPKTVPQGTEILCTAHYDNSEHNLANPDPAATVRWGEQTWDEMMIGYFDIAVPTEKDTLEDPRVSEILDRLDKNKDGRLDREEIPHRLLKHFSKLDRDGDDAVTREELAAGFAGG